MPQDNGRPKQLPYRQIRELINECKLLILHLRSISSSGPEAEPQFCRRLGAQSKFSFSHNSSISALVKASTSSKWSQSPAAQPSNRPSH